MRQQRHVGARQDRQPDDVDVLLERGRDDHLGRLAQAGVDDLEALVAQAAGEHLGAAVVAVEAGLGDEHLDRSVGHGAIVARPSGGEPALGRRRRSAVVRRRRPPLEVGEELGAGLVAASGRAQDRRSSS